MNADLPAPVESPGDKIPPLAPLTDAPAPVEQVSAAELADLRRRADRYRFLFKTIVTVTSILVGATLIVLLAAILTDM